MTNVVLSARVETHVAQAKADIQAVQAELVKLTKGATDASVAGTALGAALLIPPPVALATMAPTLAQIRTALDQQSQSATALASAQGVLGRASIGAGVDMARLAGVSTTVVEATQDEIDAMIRLGQEIDQLRQRVAPAVTAQEMLAQAERQVEAAIKAGILTQQEANVIADQARARFVGLADPLMKVERGSFAAAGGARMLSQQFSQVAQMGAVTGNWMQALAIQLPDIALGFGTVAIAASIVAMVALPLVTQWFGNAGNSAADATDRMELFKAALSSYNDYAELATSSTAELSAQFGRFGAQMRDDAQWLAQVEIGKANAAFGKVALDLETQLVGFNSTWLDLTKATDQYNQALKNGASASSEAMLGQAANIAYLTEVTNQSAATLGLTADQVLVLDTALSNMRGAKSMVAIEEVSQKALTAIRDMFPAGEAVPVAVQGIVEKLSEVHSQAAIGVATMESMKTPIGDATGAAQGFNSALAVAAGYAASIQASINSINFGNISRAAEMASLQAGFSPGAARNIGTVQQSQAQLRPLLDQGGVMGNYAQGLIDQQSAGLAEKSATDDAIAKWIKDHPVAGVSGAGSGGGASSRASLSSLTSDAVKAMADLDLAIAKINEKVRAGLMSSAEAADAVASAKGRAADELAGLVVQIDKVGPAGTAMAGQIRANMVGLAADLKSTAADLAATLSEGFKSPFKDFLTGAKEAGDAMDALGDFIIDKMADIAAQKATTGFIEPFLNTLMSGFFPPGALAFAEGGVPDAPLSSHRNKVLNKPTLFPMRDGMGLMAEAGSEAIMPVGDGGVLAMLGGREMRLPLIRGAGGRLGVQMPDWQPEVLQRAPRAFALGGVIQGGSAAAVGAGQGPGQGAGGIAFPDINFAVNITTPAGTTTTASKSMDGNTLNLDVLVEQIEGKIATNVRTGRGALNGSISEAFGLPRATR